MTYMYNDDDDEIAYFTVRWKTTPCLKKNTPDIFSCNLNEHFLISIIFGTNIT